MDGTRKDNGPGQERQWTRPGKTMAQARNENVVRQERQFRRSKLTMEGDRGKKGGNKKSKQWKSLETIKILC